MRKLYFFLIAAVCLFVFCVSEVSAGQAIQPINLATSASGQSGYVAALIENKGLE